MFVISNFACTIFGNVECTIIGNIDCTTKGCKKSLHIFVFQPKNIGYEDPERHLPKSKYVVQS